MPPLADRFSTRPESSPDLLAAVSRGPVALVPRSTAADDGWVQCCGKTQLAAYFAESQWSARAVDLLVWVDATSSASILSAYSEAGRVLTGASPTGDAQSVAAGLARWLNQTDRRWLVVFDDLADADMVRELWPTGSRGHVLVTASSSAAVAGLPGLLVAEIGPFSPREAMSYLVGRLSSDPDQRRGAMDLIEDLGCQPLALAQATAAIGSSWLTCIDYRERFVRRSSLIGQHDHRTLPPARVTWTLSLDSADYLRPGGAAQSCLVLAALLDGHGVPASAFTTPGASSFIAGADFDAGYAGQRASNALQTLEQAGLLSVDRTREPPAVWMNNILQQAVLAATPADMFEQAGQAAAAALLEIWSSGDVRPLAPRLRASAEALRRASGGLLWAGGCHPLLLRTGRSLDEEGLAGPGVDYWSELAGISDRVLGPDHDDSYTLMERLAAGYVAAGRSADAVAWSKRIMSDWASALGADSPRTLTARIRLGRVLITAGLLDEAVSVLTDALTDCERIFGPDHSQTQEAREELAAADLAAGRAGTALRIYRRTLSQRERESGAQDPATIATRKKLAQAYLTEGKTKEAISQYKRALSDSERGLGTDHPDTLRTRASLASIYQQAGRMAIALQQYELVRDGTSRVLGADHHDTLVAEINLAAAYYAVGRLTDAANAYRAVIRHGERVLGAGDPLLRSARENLAAITGE